VWLHTSTRSPHSRSLPAYVPGASAQPGCVVVLCTNTSLSISQLSVQLSRLPHFHCPALTGQHTPHVSRFTITCRFYTRPNRCDTFFSIQQSFMLSHTSLQLSSVSPPYMFLSMGGIQSVSSTDAHIGITFLRYTHHKYIYSCSVDTEACATVTAQGSRRNLRSGVDMYVRESFRRREHPSQNTPPPPPRLLTISPVWMLMAARIRNHFSVQARTLRSHDSAIHKNVSATAPSVFNPTGECQKHFDSIMQQHEQPYQARTGVSPSMLNFSKKLGFKGCNS